MIPDCDSAMASWRLTENVDIPSADGSEYLPLAAGDMLCQKHYLKNDSPPATGIWEEVEGQTGVVATEPPSPNVTLDDLLGLIRVRESQGIPESVTIQQAIVGVNALFPAADRWTRLEAHGRAAPVWLRTSEAEKLVKVLRKVTGPDARYLMQEIRDLFKIR